MHKLWRLLTNRVIAGMLCFLLLLAAWQLGIRPAYFPLPLIADEER